MLDPTVQSALVVLIAWLLTLLFQWLNVPVSKELVMSIAVALVAFILGVPAGTSVSNGIRAGVRGLRGE